MADAPTILWLDDATAAGNRTLGGKFASLAEMTQAAFSVPPGFGITTAAYRAFMAEAGLVAEAEAVRRDAASLPASALKGRAAGLVEAIREKPLPAALEAEIRAAYAALEEKTGLPEVPVAVRSSGESEDLEGASFAGQYDTYLWIAGADAVLENMRACWASLYAETVLSYRQDGEALVAKGDFAICVGVQQMVEARAAGVMFTLDPLNGDRSKIALEACWGLGEGVVKGDVTPCQFALDKVTFEIVRRKLAVQDEEYRFDPAAGAVGLVPVPAERRERPCVSDPELVELARLAKRIEQHRGAPQDIEWAVAADGAIRVLQVRPETVWSRRPAKSVVAEQRSPVGHVLSRLSGVRLSGGSPGGRSGS